MLKGQFMLTLHPAEIRQRLFRAKLPDGCDLYLAFLTSGGCAIVRDDQITETWEESEDDLAQALERFLALSRPTLDLTCNRG